MQANAQTFPRGNAKKMSRSSRAKHSKVVLDNHLASIGLVPIQRLTSVNNSFLAGRPPKANARLSQLIFAHILGNVNHAAREAGQDVGTIEIEFVRIGKYLERWQARTGGFVMHDDPATYHHNFELEVEVYDTTNQSVKLRQPLVYESTVGTLSKTFLWDKNPQVWGTTPAYDIVDFLVVPTDEGDWRTAFPVGVTLTPWLILNPQNW